MLPSLSLDVSVKLAVSPLVVKLKFATGGVLLPPPPTAARVAWASMMPAPQPPEQLPGNGRALLVMRFFTWSGVSDGLS